MRIPFFGGYGKGRSPVVNNAEVVNAFLEVSPNGVQAVYGTPGLKTWYNSSLSTSELRRIHKRGIYLYAVIGSQVYRLDKDLNKTEIGDIGTSTGIVTMASSQRELAICDGAKLYQYDIQNEGDLQEVTLPMTNAPEWVTWLGNHFVAGETGTEKFWWSDLNDLMIWNGLSFSSSEQRPDNLSMGLVDHNELWLFGDTSVEVWGYVGSSSSPFAAIQGYTFDVGIGAKHSAVGMDNDVMWLTDSWMVVKGNKGSPVFVSTREIEYQISQCTNKAGAIAFSYVHQGHWMYQLTFPTDQITFVYDAATKLWHKRTSYPNEGRHRANCCESFDGKILMGDFENGIIYEQDQGTYTDNGYEIRRIISCDHIANEGKIISYHALTLIAQVGIGLDVASTIATYDPHVMMQFSNDRGRTWSHEHWRSMGKIGEYDKEIVWRRLGASPNRQFKLVFTQALPFVIVDAFLDVSSGN